MSGESDGSSNRGGHNATLAGSSGDDPDHIWKLDPHKMNKKTVSTEVPSKNTLSMRAI